MSNPTGCAFIFFVCGLGLQGAVRSHTHTRAAVETAIIIGKQDEAGHINSHEVSDTVVCRVPHQSVRQVSLVIKLGEFFMLLLLEETGQSRATHAQTQDNSREWHALLFLRFSRGTKRTFIHRIKIAPLLYLRDATVFDTLPGTVYNGTQKKYS